MKSKRNGVYHLLKHLVVLNDNCNSRVKHLYRGISMNKINSSKFLSQMKQSSCRESEKEEDENV